MILSLISNKVFEKLQFVTNLELNTECENVIKLLNQRKLNY